MPLRLNFASPQRAKPDGPTEKAFSRKLSLSPRTAGLQDFSVNGAGCGLN